MTEGIVNRLLSAFKPPSCPEEVVDYGSRYLGRTEIRERMSSWPAGGRRITDLPPYGPEDAYNYARPFMVLDDPIRQQTDRFGVFRFSEAGSWDDMNQINKTLQTAHDRWKDEQVLALSNEIDKKFMAEQAKNPEEVKAVYEVEFDLIQQAYDEACPKWKSILAAKFPLAIQQRHPVGSRFEDLTTGLADYVLVAVSEEEGMLINLEAGSEWYGVGYSLTKRVPIKRAYNDHTAGKYYATDADMKRVYGEKFVRLNENEF